MNIIEPLPLYFIAYFQMLAFKTGNCLYSKYSTLILLEFIIGNSMWKRFFYNLGIRSGRPKYQDKFVKGMPSTHMSNMVFSTLLVLDTYPDRRLTSILLAGCVLVGYQRYSTRMHNLQQIIVGALIGMLEFYILIYMNKKSV